MKVLTEGPVVVLPSIPDQCWLSVELTWEMWPGCQICVSKSPLPICSPPVSIRKLPGQTQGPAGHACGPCLWAPSSIQLSAWDYVRVGQALPLLNRGGELGSYSFDLWRSYKAHILVHDKIILKHSHACMFLYCQLLPLSMRWGYHKKPLIPPSWIYSLSSVHVLWVNHQTAVAVFLNLKSVSFCLDFDYYPRHNLDQGYWENFLWLSALSRSAFSNGPWYGDHGGPEMCQRHWTFNVCSFLIKLK